MSGSHNSRREYEHTHVLNVHFRFTDFLVYEVDLDGNVIHVKSLTKPESSPKKKEDTKENHPAAEEGAPSPQPTSDSTNGPVPPTTEPSEKADESTEAAENVVAEMAGTPNAAPNCESSQTQNEPWPEQFTAKLTAFLSEETVVKIKELYLEGPEPPFVSDSGWGGRQAKPAEDDNKPEGEDTPATPEAPEEEPKQGRGKRGRDRGVRGGRGARGGRGGRGGRPGAREDHRRVLTDVCLGMSALRLVDRDLTLTAPASPSRPRRRAPVCTRRSASSSEGNLIRRRT